VAIPDFNTGDASTQLINNVSGAITRPNDRDRWNAYYVDDSGDENGEILDLPYGGEKRKRKWGTLDDKT